VPFYSILCKNEAYIGCPTTGCRLRYIHKPDFKRYTSTYWGAWFKDAEPRPLSLPRTVLRSTEVSTTSSWSEKVWVSLHYRGNTLLEYNNYDNFRSFVVVIVVDFVVDVVVVVLVVVKHHQILWTVSFQHMPQKSYLPLAYFFR